MGTGHLSSRDPHHRRPGLDLPLPVAQGRQGRDDEKWPRHVAQLPLVLQHRDGLRSLAQAPEASMILARWARLSTAMPVLAHGWILLTASHAASPP